MNQSLREEVFGTSAGASGLVDGVVSVEAGYQWQEKQTKRSSLGVTQAMRPRGRILLQVAGRYL